MLRLAIANDAAIAVEALRRAIATNPDYQLLWIASTGREAIEHCKTHLPDVLRMDLNMPNLIGTSAGGPHALQKILSQLPSASDTHAVAPAIVMAHRCRSSKSCVAFGMPKAAIVQGAATQILPLPQIASYLSRTLALSGSAF